MKLVARIVLLIMLIASLFMYSAAASDGAIISNLRLPEPFQYPTCDGYCGSMPAQISVTYTVTNIGDNPHSFWMGYSARPFNGVQWLDVPAMRTPVLGMGQSHTGTLTLNFPCCAPTCCWYNVDIGVWSDMAWNGLLVGELDSKSFQKAFYMTGCMTREPGGAIACIPG